MDAGDVGKYGALLLIKRSEPRVISATFPIDDEVTIGRDMKCDLRLYYDTVSMTHGKIIFQGSKAYIVVLGRHGVKIDNMNAYPSSDSLAPTTVPLSNNCCIEIAGKMFRFVYPPKQLRDTLINTPSRPNAIQQKNKTLRMSMIESAEVFSPRPSSDPLVNLRILQTPRRPGSSPLKKTFAAAYQSPGRFAAPSGDSEDEEIVLVETDCPRVSQEDEDLVILEDVEVPALPFMNHTPSPTPAARSQVMMRAAQFEQRIQQTHTPPVAQRSSTFQPSVMREAPPHIERASAVPQPPPPPPPPPPRTPRPRPSLHKAVLIRSAQRAVKRAVIEQEDLEEEEEVASFIASIEDDSDEEEVEDTGDQDKQDGTEGIVAAVLRPSSHKEILPPQDGSSDDDLNVHVIETESDLQDDHQNGHEIQETMDVEINVEGEMNDEEANESEISVRPPTPPRRNLGHFKTPQLPMRIARGMSRASLAGAPPQATPNFIAPSVGPFEGPRRVRVDPAWKVHDIKVDNGSDQAILEPMISRTVQEGVVAAPSPMRPKLSEQEREAIRERRRSARVAPDPLFANGAPGIRRLSAIAVEDFSPASPFKRSLLSPFKSVQRPSAYTLQRETLAEDDGEDTHSMLDRMRETVENMKHRSTNGRASISPDKLFLPSHPSLFEEPKSEVAHADVSMEDAFPSTQPLRQQDSPTLPSAAVQGKMRQISFNSMYMNPRAPPPTPKLDGMRELFQQPADAPETPAMDGVRAMLVHGKIKDRQSMVLEGVGVLMRTPGAYTSAPVVERDQEMHQQHPVRNTRSSGASICSSSPKRPRSVVQRDRATPGEASNFADDELTPGDANQPDKQGNSEVDEAPAPKKGRILRGRKAASEQPEMKEAQVQEQSIKPSSKPKPSSKTQPKEAANAPEVPASPPKPVRRGRKAPSVEPTPSRISSSDGPARRTRRATSEEPQSSAAKPSRSTRTPASAPTIEEAENEGDELDTMQVPELPSTPEPKVLANSGRVVKKTVPQKRPADEAAEGPPAEKRQTKIPTRRPTAAKGTAVPKSANARGRNRTASVNHEADDKENTPEGKKASVKSTTSPTKGTRTRKGAKVTSKTDVSADEVPVKASRARARK